MYIPSQYLFPLWLPQEKGTLWIMQRLLSCPPGCDIVSSTHIAFVKASHVVNRMIDVWSCSVPRRMGIFLNSPENHYLSIASFSGVLFLLSLHLIYHLSTLITSDLIRVGNWLIDNYRLARSLWGSLAWELCLSGVMVNWSYCHPLLWELTLGIVKQLPGITQLYHVQNQAIHRKK